MKYFLTFYHTLRFWIVIISLSIILGTVAVFLGIFDKSGNQSHKIAALWRRLICRWNGIKVKITGADNILVDKPKIFIANHQAYYDLFDLAGTFY